ncbi:unnamed protein product, partial [Porites evermanni]
QHIYVISGLRLPSSCRSRRENKLFEVVRKTWSGNPSAICFCCKR